MLPNRFPDAGETPEYNTVDATLWFSAAIRAYLSYTGDLEIVRDLYGILTDVKCLDFVECYAGSFPAREGPKLLLTAADCGRKDARF